MTATSCVRRASRSALCSTMRIAVPDSLARRASASPTSRVPAGSSWLVGSSRTSTPGCSARTEARATSCACPPESRSGSRGARCSIPSRARLRSTRSMIAGKSRPTLRGPKATSSNTVEAVPDSCVSGFWNRIPQRWAASYGLSSTVSVPSRVTEPVSRPPIDVGREPGGHQAQGRLAGVIRADEPDDSSRGHHEVDVDEHGRARPGVGVTRPSDGQRHSGQPDDAKDRGREEDDRAPEDRPADEALRSTVAWFAQDGPTARAPRTPAPRAPSIAPRPPTANW